MGANQCNQRSSRGPRRARLTCSTEIMRWAFELRRNASMLPFSSQPAQSGQHRLSKLPQHLSTGTRGALACRQSPPLVDPSATINLRTELDPVNRSILWDVQVAGRDYWLLVCSAQYGQPMNR